MAQFRSQHPIKHSRPSESSPQSTLLPSPNHHVELLSSVPNPWEVSQGSLVHFRTNRADALKMGVSCKSNNLSYEAP